MTCVARPRRTLIPMTASTQPRKLNPTNASAISRVLNMNGVSRCLAYPPYQQASRVFLAYRGDGDRAALLTVLQANGYVCGNVPNHPANNFSILAVQGRDASFGDSKPVRVPQRGTLGGDAQATRTVSTADERRRIEAVRRAARGESSSSSAATTLAPTSSSTLGTFTKESAAQLRVGQEVELELGGIILVVDGVHNAGWQVSGTDKTSGRKLKVRFDAIERVLR